MRILAYLTGLATAAAVSGAVAFAQGGQSAADPVLATVNGVPITFQQLAGRVLQQFGQPTLEAMVNRAVLDQAAQKERVTVSPAEVQARLDQIQKAMGGVLAYSKFLEASGMSDQLQREQLRYLLLNEKLALKASPITDRDLERLQVRIIATNNLDQAKTVIRLLRQRQDFATMVGRYSEHPNRTAADPGLLEPFTWFQMPQIWSHASKLQPGQFTEEPVKASDGYLIIKLEKRLPAAQMKPAERTQYLALLTAQRSTRWLENARKAAQVSYPTPLKNLLESPAARGNDARAVAGP
jgi:parvulin-like peptidyl-prolyl isomerase